MSNPIVSFDEQAAKDKLRELVRKTIEETINAMLDEEADQLVGAGPYERTDERAAYRAGHYEHGFTTTSGLVTLKMPKLKGMRFATAVVERYKRRETSVEEAIIEMRLAGVSTRRIEDVSEILWGAGVSAGTVPNLNEKAFKAVEEWRCRPLTREYPYVYVDGIYLKRSWGGSYENVAVMVAIGVNENGHREMIGCAEGFTESSECWHDFLSWLKSRGLRGVRMFVGDKAAGMVGSIAEVPPRSQIPALHRALLPQRPRQGPQIEAFAGRGHAQGHPRDGVARGGRRQGRGRGRRPGIDAAQGGRQGGARRARRDAGVLRHAARALAAHSHQQRDRAPEQGNTPAHPRCGHVPRREIRLDAGDRAPEVRRGKRMGIAPLPGRVASQGVAVPTAG